MMELVSITLSGARMGGVAGRRQSGEAHVKKLKWEREIEKGKLGGGGGES